MNKVEREKNERKMKPLVASLIIVVPSKEGKEEGSGVNNEGKDLDLNSKKSFRRTLISCDLRWEM